MSVNFGYGGYNMMNGMGGANQMQMQNQGGGIYQSIASQYSCPMCYQYGVQPYNHQTFVNPIPRQAAYPSFFERVMKKLLGG